MLSQISEGFGDHFGNVFLIENLFVALDERVISVLYHVLGSFASKFFKNIGPFPLKNFSLLEKFDVFLESPLSPVDIAVDVIKPHLPAFLEVPVKPAFRSPKEFKGDLFPFFDNLLLRDDLNEEHAFFFGPSGSLFDLNSVMDQTFNLILDEEEGLADENVLEILIVVFSEIFRSYLA